MQQATNPKRSWWLLAGCGAVAAIVLCVIVLIIAGWSFFSLGEPQQELSRTEIESLGRLTLPSGADNLHAMSGGFQDRYLFASFAIPASDFSLLARNQHWPELDASRGASEVFQKSLAPDQPWWQPETAQQFLSGTSAVNGVYQSVLVDTSDPKQYIVYVQTIES